MGHGVAKGNWDLEMRPALSFQYIYIYLYMDVFS